jgi:hypothetical protein
MGLLFIGIGIILVLCGNIPGGYHKHGTPSVFVRISWTSAGLVIFFLGLHYVTAHVFK